MEESGLTEKEWDSFFDGKKKVGKMGSDHVSAAIRYVHRTSRKKLPHPILMLFNPDDDGMVPFEELEWRVSLLLLMWGALCTESVCEVRNGILLSLTRSDWSGDKGDYLPGMEKDPRLESGDEKFSPDSMLRKVESRLKKMRSDLKKSTSWDDLEARERELKSLEERFLSFPRILDSSSPWITDLLSDSVSHIVSRIQEDHALLMPVFEKRSFALHFADRAHLL